MIKEIIEIANKLKTLGGGTDYQLPNEAFALVCYYYLSNQTDGQCEKDGATLKVEVETEDDKGESLDQAYFDLMTLVVSENNQECRLCIPVPLMQPEAVLTIVKSGAKFVMREQHDRQYDSSPLLKEEFEEDYCWHARAFVAQEFECLSIDEICSQILL